MNDPRFKHIPPASQDIVRLHEHVRGAIGITANDIGDRLPPCRETSLFFTKMEEAMFWANAAIAREISAKSDMTSDEG